MCPQMRLSVRMSFAGFTSTTESDANLVSRSVQCHSEPQWPRQLSFAPSVRCHDVPQLPRRFAFALTVPYPGEPHWPRLLPFAQALLHIFAFLAIGTIYRWSCLPALLSHRWLNPVVWRAIVPRFVCSTLSSGEPLAQACGADHASLACHSELLLPNSGVSQFRQAQAVLRSPVQYQRTTISHSACQSCFGCCGEPLSPRSRVQSSVPSLTNSLLLPNAHQYRNDTA